MKRIYRTYADTEVTHISDETFQGCVNIARQALGREVNHEGD